MKSYNVWSVWFLLLNLLFSIFSHIKYIHIYIYTHTHIHTYIYSFWWKKYSIAWIYHILFTHSLNDTNLSFLLGGINLIMLLQISCTYPYEHMFTILGYRMVSTFKLLCLMLLWTFMYIFFFLCRHMFSILMGTYQTLKLLWETYE